jgi:hypothetical protein
MQFHEPERIEVEALRVSFEEVFLLRNFLLYTLRTMN